MKIIDNLENYSFDSLLQQALSRVPDDIDKREGSIIYDALSPACYVLALAYLELATFYQDTFVTTATGEDLDNRAIEQGITRFLATYSIRKGYFTDADGQPVSVPMGSRFSTLSESDPIIFTVTDEYEELGVPVPGYYELTCETLGTDGNKYSGNLTAISIIPGLSVAELQSILIPARDEETDDELRSRYLISLGKTTFGGNIEDYREKLMSLEGVGALQIYPTWNGGGTVKLSIVDPQYNRCTDEFISHIQEEVDPEVNHGAGLGIAPIGHTVTVVTPDEVKINISCDLTPEEGRSIQELQDPIKSAISSYIDEVKRTWATPSSLNVYYCSIYIAKITAIIISVPGVSNVADVQINGTHGDIRLVESSTTQQIPSLGTVVLDG